MAATKILIVEDERLIGLATRKMLEANGYQCMWVITGEEAVDVVREFRPDIILLDIGLSGNIDGITTARIIRKEHDQSVPIVYTTQMSDDHYYQQAKETWPRDYLIKPFSEKELLRKIELTVQERRMLQEDFQMLPKERGENIIYLRTPNNAYDKIQCRDILYVNAIKGYTNIHCKWSDGKTKCYTIIGGASQILPQINYPAIVRIQKSYYINMDNIDGLHENAVLVGGARIPIGREYKAELMRRITLIRTSQK